VIEPVAEQFTVVVFEANADDPNGSALTLPLDTVCSSRFAVPTRVHVTLNSLPYDPLAPLNAEPGIDHGPPETVTIGAPSDGDSITR
jgi:hypothetical protein